MESRMVVLCAATVCSAQFIPKSLTPALSQREWERTAK